MLGHVRRLLTAGTAILREPPWAPPGHFYSPVPGRADTARAVRALGRERAAAPREGPAGVELNAEGQRMLFKQLSVYFPDLPTVRTPGRRYHPDNSMYGLGDAAVYHAMLRRCPPRRVVEVGSGYSSAVALDTAERHLDGVAFTFIEPYPQRLLGLLGARDRERCTLIARPVQEVDLRVFTELAAGDVLFIDSSHVSKAGSDVNFLFFDVLPRLADGVLVHVHDILWPFEYPERWLRQRRGWTESYLLRAFLQYNSVFTVELFNAWLWENEPDTVRELLPAAAGQLPGGIWLRKGARPEESEPASQVV
ncbi:class I SAM-dependent methyltransferase [Actinospica durhamensis]|uniref:Class I SAM-dependent methyltransferase n=1 Tax=Actinospica durhamensis TaxID=1508375 RepID=A0A941IRE8_9ACTN|nr:class I SAM-dependent methyltransferase [Actinospica durhamensis]MBR7835227.1 class I SAM-dependent methyltransferase [Actinospica durhamensis]